MASTKSTEILLGIFVGGASRRMGGEPKGLLKAPDTGEPLVSRLWRIGLDAGMRPVLVGDASPYRALDLVGGQALTDAPGIPGPLGGLAALLESAGARRAIAVGCDMPAVTAEALSRLAKHAPAAAVVAPRRGADAPWEPMFARYAPAAVLPALLAAADEGVRSFQGLLGRLEVVALPVDPVIDAALCDWDTPEDVAG